MNNWASATSRRSIAAQYGLAGSRLQARPGCARSAGLAYHPLCTLTKCNAVMKHHALSKPVWTDPARPKIASCRLSDLFGITRRGLTEILEHAPVSIRRHARRWRIDDCWAPFQVWKAWLRPSTPARLGNTTLNEMAGRRAERVVRDHLPTASDRVRGPVGWTPQSISNPTRPDGRMTSLQTCRARVASIDIRRLGRDLHRHFTIVGSHQAVNPPT